MFRLKQAVVRPRVLLTVVSIILRLAIGVGGKIASETLFWLKQAVVRPRVLLIVVPTILVLAVGVSVSFASETFALHQPPEGLFVDASNAANLTAPSDPTIIRSRFVEVKFDLLPGASSSVGVSNQLDLNLFDDANFSASLDHIEPANLGGYVWIGRLDNVAMSQVVLVVNNGLMVGNISSPNGIYQVRHTDGNTHVIYQVNQSAFPPEAEPVPVEYTEAELAEAAASPMADDGSTIDILVVYTADTRSGAGSVADMETLISMAVAETNASYSNSDITQRLNLVHTAEVSYTETGNITTDLNRLKEKTDGFMDNVHALRDTYVADVVTLIVENGGEFCGFGFIMETVSTAFEDRAFNVTKRSCATGNYSFGHELGHIMSARHDWYVDASNNKPYTYNHGYINTAARWRTIMAYDNLCNDSGVGNCTRLPYWSNPNKTYSGDPMGVTAGTSTVCIETSLSNPACDADNHQTLNNTAITVANFRESLKGLNVNIVGSGSVTRNPDQPTYPAGTNVSLEAIPASGWRFVGWSGELTGNTNPTTITMDSNKTITATFEPISPNNFTLTINIIGNGSVTRNPDQPTYLAGTNVSLEAIPASGWRFVGWSGDLSGNTNPTTITMDSNKTITATFEQSPTACNNPVTPPGATIGFCHQVQPTDTLYGLGRLYGVDPFLISRLNQLYSPNLIYDDQSLFIPEKNESGTGPNVYIVKPGDTLAGVADQCRLPISSLAQANGLDPTAPLNECQALIIPVRSYPPPFIGYPGPFCPPFISYPPRCYFCSW